MKNGTNSPKIDESRRQKQEKKSKINFLLTNTKMIARNEKIREQIQIYVRFQKP
jgi:hypothetical protein